MLFICRSKIINEKVKAAESDIPDSTVLKLKAIII